ncbi:hypothetical protein HRR06_01890 [Gardnerella vaginalis]|nr:hypothetical protein [Gardnerella vaginalis]NSX44506.1 hypothetical protein [Gardnerella vaginalis]
MPALFKPLFSEGWRIRFAHKTFAWNAQSTDNANVHVVIIGMDTQSDKILQPVLYSYEKINGEPTKTIVSHINPYLVGGGYDIFVEKRSQKEGTLSPILNRVDKGSQPTDGGNLILNTREEYDEAMKDTIAPKYVCKFIGAKELINDKNRWCLWLVDAEPNEMRESKFISRRIEKVKDMRLLSTKLPTRIKANTPWFFDENHQKDCQYLAIPATVSGRRTYYTCNLFDKNTIAGNQIYVCLIQMV